MELERSPFKNKLKKVLTRLFIVSFGSKIVILTLRKIFWHFLARFHLFYLETDLGLPTTFKQIPLVTMFLVVHSPASGFSHFVAPKYRIQETCKRMPGITGSVSLPWFTSHPSPG